MPAAQQTILGPRDGESVQLGGMGVRFMIDVARSGGGFSLVEHPIAPRALASPVHTHEREDEYSYVLEGRVGVEIGTEVQIAGPGDLVFKPRGVPHAFWNAGDDPARVLEIISPGGFEQYFREIAALVPPSRPEPDFEAIGAVMARYGMTMEPTSVERLVAEHDLQSIG